MSEEDITWDLSELYSGCDDPEISNAMDALIGKADEISKQYKGKINIANFTAQNLHDLLVKYELILAGVEELEIYSYNSFHANMTLPETKALYNKFTDFQSTISKKLTFLELKIGRLVTDNPQILDEETLSNYINYLEIIRRKFPFKLSETEEQLILEKDQYGAKAWEQLRSSWISTRKFKATVEGKEKIISFSEFFPLKQHPDRETRISVYKSVCNVLRKEEEIYSSVLRNICGDWVKTTKRRDYDNPIHQSLIDNDTNEEIIDNLLHTIEENIHLQHRFLKIKAKLLNLPKLGGVDILALLPFEKKYTWYEAKKLILQVYGTFDKTFEDYVLDIFDRNYIDASTREGKAGGAYCFPWYNRKSAFILTPFKGLISEIIILTHELGHGIHFYLSSREQTFLNYMPGMTVAETASKFGELLLTDYLMNTSQSQDEKITVLTNQLTFASFVFRASARFRFEQSLYNAITEGEYLDGETISKYWCSARDNVFKDSVKWIDEMKWKWITVPHYFFPNFRFYNYPYAYAQLFVYALYQTYKNEGESFVPKFKKLLRAGGSLPPEELGKIVDLDINTPDFWNLGMKQYEVFVDELEKLTN